MMICQEDRHCPLCSDSCSSYIEVEEVHHGHWIDANGMVRGAFTYGKGYAMCSCCGKISFDANNDDYCRKCGAAMDEIGNGEMVKACLNCIHSRVADPDDDEDIYYCEFSTKFAYHSYECCDRFKPKE